MINTEKLKPILDGYKGSFSKHWPEEKFKWEAVKYFQDHWDIDAPDFVGMFNEATKKTSKLLATGTSYPKKMILSYAKADENTTRQMFIDLFDESKDLSKRVDQFRTESSRMREKYNDGTWKHDYQNTKAISTYLWLRFPDKYYIYMPSYMKQVAPLLGEESPVENGSVKSMLDAFAICDDICNVILKDEGLCNLISEVITDKCWPDKKMHTTVIDIVYYIKKHYIKEKEDKDSEWFPDDYSPELTVDDWQRLLKDDNVFTQSAKEIVVRMKDNGGQATCKQLSNKYGESPEFYSSGSTALAQRVANKTGCPLLQHNTENSKWWPILYVGRYADNKENGEYIWKLRDELADAIEDVDMSKIKLYSVSKEDSGINYWWLNANQWDISGMDIGSIQNYDLYTKDKKRLASNLHKAKVGDKVIGYMTSPDKQIVALCEVVKVTDEYVSFEKVEGLSKPISYAMLKSQPELAKAIPLQPKSQGSFFRLTEKEYDFIIKLIREQNPLSNINEGYKGSKYTENDFLSEVFLSQDDYKELKSLLLDNLNVILYGPPGVGKTFAARRLAYSIMGKMDDYHIEMIQFHQNYSYEDFIMGYKPEGDQFVLKEGVFYRFCKKAEQHPDEKFFFIIDEINRGNLSKIMGELMMLIENDKRGKAKVTLAYSDEQFTVPKNLYIIGMMNTADRSLAMIDYALRRRFSFYEMKPAFNSNGFKTYRESLNNEMFNKLIDTIKELNQAITDAEDLGKGYCIGHSYFSEWDECTRDKIKEVVKYSIIPMLEEYWFDNEKQLSEWTKTLKDLYE